MKTVYKKYKKGGGGKKLKKKFNDISKIEIVIYKIYNRGKD